MGKKLNRKFEPNYRENSEKFVYWRTQSMSDHFTKILSRMELNDLRSEDSAENPTDEERRIVNGGKTTFANYFEQMR